MKCARRMVIKSDILTFCPMGEKLFLMKFPTIGQVHFDSIGVEVRKWGTSGVKFQLEIIIGFLSYQELGKFK